MQWLPRRQASGFRVRNAGTEKTPGCGSSAWLPPTLPTLLITIQASGGHIVHGRLRDDSVRVPEEEQV